MNEDKKHKSKRKDPKKSFRRKKPVFNDFLEIFRRTITVADERAVKQVAHTLNLGFVGAPQSQHIHTLQEGLKNWEGSDRLALIFAINGRFGRLASVSKIVLEYLRDIFTGLIEYPLNTPYGLTRPEYLSQWIRVQTDEKRQCLHEVTGAESPIKHFDINAWFRMLLVCLLAEDDDSVFRECAYVLLAIQLELYPRKKLKRIKPDKELANLLADILNGAHIGKWRIVLTLLAVRNEMVDKLGWVNRQIESALKSEQKAISKVREVEELAKNVSKKLEESRQLEIQLNATLTQKETALAAEAERYQALDDHWQRVSKTMVARFAGSIRSKLAHEVQEAFLSLDQESPDVPMAISRIKKMQELVEELYGEH